MFPIELKCQICKKIFSVTKCEKNRKVCSRKCQYKYFKIHKIGAFFDPKVRAIGNETRRKNKLGFYNPETGRKGAATNKKNRTGLYGITKEQRTLNSKKGVLTNKKNGTGLYDSKIRSIGAKIGGKRTHELHPNQARETGIKVAKILRDKKGHVFNNINFDSKSEMEFGMNIHYQIEKLKEGKNYSIHVGFFTCDFYIKKFNCFIEYHPYNPLYDKDDINLEKYYKRRRKNLNVNKFEDANLLIIK